MHLIFSVLRMIVFFAMFAVIAIVAGISLLIGGALFLLFGRRPNFQILTMRPQPPPTDFGGRPPMKDVTPHGG